MMMPEIAGSQWDTMMDILIEGDKCIDAKRYCFIDELSTMDLMENSKILRYFAASNLYK